MLKAGERLKEERLVKGITLEEASLATKIRISFLSHIEKGEYEKLPSVAYAQGFVRNYTRFLGLSEKEILALFRREFDENKTFRVLPAGLARKEEFPLKKIKLKQTVILGILVFIAFILYIIFQYRFAFLGPTLSISNPKEGQMVSSSSVEVVGDTSLDSTVFVNDEPAVVGDDGSFRKDINIFPGDNRITVRSVNRSGKETAETINIKAQ